MDPGFVQIRLYLVVPFWRMVRGLFPIQILPSNVAGGGLVRIRFVLLVLDSDSAAWSTASRNCQECKQFHYFGRTFRIRQLFLGYL
ncbi:unnamed protein product [Gongylonema pulchrum]|uniref:Secreted protein n=1 Tax=Gongylonema pulchrum TaxID=637853 RepID=A0A183EZK8_9BILA|nr:unnamed protein product [Gongylonema pulchrum]